MRSFARLLLLGALALAAGACSHFRAARQRPRLRGPLERGAYGFLLGRSAAQTDAAAAKLGLRDHPGRFNRRPPVEMRAYDVAGGTAAHVSVALVDGRAQGVTAAFAKGASFPALAADLERRYGPPQLRDDGDLYWSDGWTAIRLARRGVDGFEEAFLEAVEVPRLGKIGFTRFGLDQAVVFGPKGFAVRDPALSTGPALGCGAPPAYWDDPRVQQARDAVLLGDFARAAAAAESVIAEGRQDDSEAQAWQIRAAALYRLGRKDSARASWLRAYEIDECLADIPAFLARPDY